MKIKALICGHRGLVGALLTQALLEKGYDVYAVVRTPSTHVIEGVTELAHEKWWEHLETLTHGCTFGAVVHGAGHSSLAAENEHETIALDVNIAQAIAHFAVAQSAKLMFVSSAHAVALHGSICDESEPSSHTPYGRLKRAVEKAIFELTPNAVGLRLAPVLSTKSKGLLGLFAAWVQSPLPLLLPTPDLSRSYITELTLRKQFLFLLEHAKAQGCYLLAEPQSASLAELAEQLSSGKFIIALPAWLLKFMPKGMRDKFLEPLCIKCTALKALGYENAS